MATVRVVWQLTSDPGAGQRLLEDVAGGEVGRLCPSCGATDHGRPVAPELHLSLARAWGVVVVAIAEHPVGVDAERLDAAWPDGTDGLLLHPDDVVGSDEDRTRLWVRKESHLKATGAGLRQEPSSLQVGTRTHDVEIEGYAVSVTVLDDADVILEVAEAPSG